MKAEYCVILDSDGHFKICDSTDRKATIELLKKIGDGDYWNDMAEEYWESVGAETEADLLTIDDASWKEFIGNFQQRGIMELGTILYTKD